MDREKVIKGVHDARRYFEDREWVDKSVGVHIDAMNDALALLKEQEAKTVESIQISRNFYAELTGYCPSCKRPLKNQFNNKFCGNCGQAVKWDD